MDKKLAINTIDKALHGSISIDRREIEVSLDSVIKGLMALYGDDYIKEVVRLATLKNDYTDKLKKYKLDRIIKPCRNFKNLRDNDKQFVSKYKYMIPVPGIKRTIMCHIFLNDNDIDIISSMMDKYMSDDLFKYMMNEFTNYMTTYDDEGYYYTFTLDSGVSTSKRSDMSKLYRKHDHNKYPGKPMFYNKIKRVILHFMLMLNYPEYIELSYNDFQNKYFIYEDITNGRFYTEIQNFNKRLGR